VAAPGSAAWPDDDAEPAAADIPAAGADVDSGVIPAQPPQILVMHDAGPVCHQLTTI
jgi:hypothetical protein